MTFLKWLLALSLLLGSFGCATYVPTKRFEYDPVPVPFQGERKASLAVLSLEENRPERQYPNLQGHLFASYIPLLPYVKIAYERLDESAMMHEKKKKGRADSREHFTHLISAAIAKDLAKAGYFKQVWHAPSPEKIPENMDYVLTGELRSTEFDYYVSSYMLGMPGVLLWLLPIPMGSNHAYVEAILYLRDREGNLLWQHALCGEGKKWLLAYTSGGAALSSQFSLEIARYGANDKGIDGDSVWAYHAEALRSGMEEAKQSLAAFLEQRQKSGCYPSE